ncbi:MAG: hypothetical protein HN350_17560, partial [Phycisphaerales bacterium]|nr:hypothetical protein [Phycisphaerales bacterium]
MNNTIIATVLIFMIALSCMADQAPGNTAELVNVKELLKLNKDLLPPNMFSGKVFRLSPSGNRFMYIRMYPGPKYGCKIHLGQFKPVLTDSAVVWERTIPGFYCRMTLAGIAWRNDSQRVLFLQEADTNQKICQRMDPWAMMWDIKNPQLKLIGHMRLGDRKTTGCTGASYSPDGKTTWTAFSDVKSFTVCGVTEKVQGRAMSRVVYKSKGRLIHYLTPSPDGKHLAWVETFQRTRANYKPPNVVVVDIKSKKVIRRIVLSKHIPSWLDAKAPVWTTDSAAICYGDVIYADRLWRREVRVMPVTQGKKLANNTSRLLTRDSIAIGAVDGGIVLNRGPACIPSRQSISSYAPPGTITPISNDIIFCSLKPKTQPETLIKNAFVQHVRKDDV